MLPVIDVGTISAELDINVKARTAGGRDLPNNTETSLDSTEQDIVARIATLYRNGRTTAEETVHKLLEQFAEISLVGYQRQIKELPDYIRIQVNKGLRSHQLELVALRKRERRMLGALNAFEDTHGLEEPASYPESKIYHWSIVAAMVLVESIANSYFFAKGSDLGLIGGALQALLISAVNIGMALFAGNYLLRNFHHISILRRIFAAGGMLIYGLFVLLFNLATAHYRALLEVDPATALVNTIPSLRNGLFDFDNFDAAILLFIGIIFAVAAMIKSYKADSVYPGHGALDRRYRTADEEYREAREMVRKAAHQEFDNGSATADRLEREARKAAYEQPVIINQLEKFAGEYHRYNSSINEAQKTLLQSYRERNSKVRPSPPPAYFSEYPNVVTDSELPLKRLNKDKKEAEKADEFLNDIEKEVANFSENIRKLDAEVNKEIDEFIADIEEEAAKETAQATKIDGPGN